MSQGKPIQFIISILIHTDGEVTFSDDQQTCFVKGISIHPVVDVIGDISEQDRATLQMMALHTVLTECAKKMKRTSLQEALTSSTEIPVTPPKGGVH